MDNTEHPVKLTSAELSNLWTLFQNDTMAICGISYFLENIEDQQIRAILELTLTQSQEQKMQVTQFFIDEDYPVPLGFTEKDVYLDAPRLFSDKLYLEYILNMTYLALEAYGLALSLVERADVFAFFSTALTNTQKLQKQAKELAKEKGIFVRSPHIPTPSQIDFVNKKSFLAGWFGDRRPLLGVEIMNLVFNAKRNALGQALITGFSQVAKSKEVRHYFERGREISGKHLEVFASILHDEYLDSGTLIKTPGVSDSTTSPFSDKMMMYQVTALIASSMGQYGVAISTSPRHDLGVHYTRLIAEVAKYSNDGAKIMIENGWMEQPPMAADRKELAE